MHTVLCLLCIPPGEMRLFMYWVCVPIFGWDSNLQPSDLWTNHKRIVAYPSF